MIVPQISLEVKTINKQKFLAELGRLLTFMYEEDRQTALAMYTRMFDMADNEQALLQFLVSPTRQAVVLARTYDSSQRKLQVRSQHREAWQQDSGETPAFVHAIEELENEALSLGVTAPEEDADQFSLFDEGADAEQADSEQATEEQPAAEAVSEPEPAAPAEQPEEAPAPEAAPIADSADSEEPAPEAPAEEAEAQSANAAQETGSDAESETETEAEGEAEPEPAGAEGAEAEEPEASAESESAKAADEDAVDAFLADFSIKADDASESEAQPKAADATAPEAAVGAPVAVEDELMPELDDLDAPAKTVRKARVPLLILYIIFAVPIGLVAVLLLLVPTALCLSVAVSTAASGIAVLLPAFGGFAMLSDILAVFGTALILLALAVLFAWLFVWFIGGAIVGVIRGLCSLGRKWCYKEVPADE